MKKKVSRLLDNDTFVRIMSIISALVIWAVISLTVSVEANRTVRDVGIDLSLKGTALEVLGLSVIDSEQNSVDIKVDGNRIKVNSLSSEDFNVTVQLGQVTGPGKFDLPVNVTLKEGSAECKIVDFTPKSIEATFDRVTTKSFPIEVDISGISAKTGYLIDKGYSSILEVNVTGPETIVNKVAKCVAKTTTKETLEATQTLPATIIMFDEGGNKVESPHIKLDKETVDVSIPVLKKKTVPIKLHFLNQPTGFPIESFKYTLAHTELEVAGPEDVITNYNEIDLRYIDFKTVRPGDSVTLAVELPGSFINIQNITTIKVDIDSKNMTEKWFNVSKFNIVGAPSNMNVIMVTKRINNVRIVGEKSILSKLSYSDIVAEVDLAGMDVSEGQFTVPVKITIPGKGLVWAVGDYAALVSARK